MTTTTTTKFRIEDWTGKVCFAGKTFDTFDDGWSFIYEHDPVPEDASPNDKEHWFDDYYVEPVPGNDGD